MTDMVERVARAICVGDPDGTYRRLVACDPPLLGRFGVIRSNVETPNWEMYVDKARAAIAAMRDCTPEMLDAGSAAHPAGGYKRETLLNDIIECEWRAMVNAALGGK